MEGTAAERSALLPAAGVANSAGGAGGDPPLGKLVSRLLLLIERHPFDQAGAPLAAAGEDGGRDHRDRRHTASDSPTLRAADHQAAALVALRHQLEERLRRPGRRHGAASMTSSITPSSSRSKDRATRLRQHADLVPPSTSAAERRSPRQPAPTPRRRGRPPKNRSLDQHAGRSPTPRQPGTFRPALGCAAWAGQDQAADLTVCRA